MVDLENLTEIDRPRMQLRYRNNGETAWSNWEDIDLGMPGETEFLVKLKRLGVFSSRQYEIRCSDNVPLVFSNAEAEITVLR